MKTNYYDVEIRLGMWCAKQEERYAPFNNLNWQCSCPTLAELKSMPYEALTALSEALKSGDYDGDWKKYLELED